jgi:hypothetical protein
MAKDRAYWDALVAVVEQVLAPLPAGAAVLTTDFEAWTIKIQPSDPAAAAVEIGDAGKDEIYLAAGNTVSSLWGDPEGLAADVERILQGIVEGRFTQAGVWLLEGRIDTSDDFIGLGQWTFVPWQWLPRKVRFAAYA